MLRNMLFHEKETRHGLQRRMVLVDNFFEIFKLLFFALLVKDAS